MTAHSDEAMLRTAFVLEHKDRLDHALGLLPPERLPGIIANASQLGLWPEALDLLDHLSDVHRGPVADVVAAQTPEVIEGLVAAVSSAGIWENLLPVVGVMSEASRLRLAANPAFHPTQVLSEILEAAADSGLWVDLVPLLRALPSGVAARVPSLVAELDRATLAAIVTEAVGAADVLEPFADILAGMDESAQASVVALIDSDDGLLGHALVGALTDPHHVRLLLDHTPTGILDAIERAADRLGLRDELDAAKMMR